MAHFREPQDTIPTWYPLQINGPPLSPLHVSSPTTPPAQIMLEIRWNFECFFLQRVKNYSWFTYPLSARSKQLRKLSSAESELEALEESTERSCPLPFPSQWRSPAGRDNRWLWCCPPAWWVPGSRSRNSPRFVKRSHRSWRFPFRTFRELCTQQRGIRNLPLFGEDFLREALSISGW